MQSAHIFSRKVSTSQEAQSSPWRILVFFLNRRGFPGGSVSKEPTCQCRRLRFDPWVGKIPWRRKWQPPPVFLPWESHGQRSLADYSPWGCKELDMTEWLSNNRYEEFGLPLLTQEENAAFLLSTLNSFQGELKISSCSSTWFNPCRGRWLVPICSWRSKRGEPLSW